jgi:DNA-binding CsgD family transcriptional regulator
VVGGFVGRTSELNTLGGVAAGAQPASVALVIGDPGSGKSRLLAEASARTGSRNVMHLAGYEAESAVPLAAASTLLRTLTRAGENGATLDTLLFAGRDEGGVSLDPLRIFEAAHRALGSLEPVLLVLDDLQWVDPLSIALCHYLLRAARDSRHGLVVLAATRPSATSIAFADSASHALGSDAVTLLALGGLDRDSGIQLVRSAAPRLSEAEANQLWIKAAGSPFWLEALARTGGVQADARQLLGERQREASADSTMLLGLLAVASRPLALSEAGRLADWPSERLENAASELVARGLAVDASGVLRPAHDLIREAALAALPNDTVRRLHRTIADWLEREAHDDLQLLFQALEHQRAAGLPTLGLATRVARSPRRRLLGEEGLRELAQIADAEMPVADDEIALHREVAAVATELAIYEQALKRWSLVAKRTKDPFERQAALFAASKVALSLGREQEAEELLDLAQAAARPRVVEELEFVAHRANISFELGRLEEARSLAQESAGRARALAAARGGIDALDRASLQAYASAMGAAAGNCAWYERNDEAREAREAAAEDWLEAARALDEETYLAASLAIALENDAIEQIRTVRDDANRLVIPSLALEAGVMLVQRLLTFGRLLEAEAAAAESTELATRVPDPAGGRQTLSYFKHLIALYRGDWPEGLRALLGQAADEPKARLRHSLLIEHAHWLARIGGRAHADDVLASLAQARSLEGEGNAVLQVPMTRLASAEALARIGRVPEAREALAEWDLHHRSHFPWEPLRRRVAEALLSLQVGDRASGIAELERAVPDTAEAGLALEVIWTQLDLGRALVQGDRPRAAETFRQAAAAAAELGAVTLAELAEHELRSLGVRTWRRGHASKDLSALTEREYEVASLIAAGASNPEIAERLFLSRKTVERHVSNALAKVGVRNRTELATRLASRPPSSEEAAS